MVSLKSKERPKNDKEKREKKVCGVSGGEMGRRDGTRVWRRKSKEGSKRNASFMTD